MKSLKDVARELSVYVSTLYRLAACICTGVDTSHKLSNSGNYCEFRSVSVVTVLSYLYEKEKRTIAYQATKLTKANEELRQFAYRISHDLKSPLVTIRRLAKAVSEDLNDGGIAESKRNVAAIEKRAVDLEELITNLLNLAKADIDTPNNELVDLKAIISGIKDRLLSTYDDSGVFLISVEDNGLGIPEKYAKRMFSMFERFHPNVSPGTGLGLCIVKTHADKLGAEISYSRTQNGSCFDLIILR